MVLQQLNFDGFEAKDGQANLGKIIPQSAMPSMDKTPDMLHFPGIEQHLQALPPRKVPFM
jgi:hypothetical protein